MTLVTVGRNDLFTFTANGECHHSGWYGTASRANKPTRKGTYLWTLYDRKGNTIRTTRSEQVAIDHCVGSN